MTNPDGPLPPRPGLPSMGARGACRERQCTREMASGGVCGRSPVLHIMWEDLGVGEGVEHGMACAGHVEEVRRLWKPWATHAIGDCCGMPGSTFRVEENICVFEDLPTAEPLRALAVEVPNV